MLPPFEETTDDVSSQRKSEIVSNVADTRRVPMEQLVNAYRGLIAETVRRIVPDCSVTTVPVASAFNSSI